MTRPLTSAVRAMRPGVFADLQARIDAVAAAGRDLVGLHIGDTCVAPPDVGATWQDPVVLGAYGATAALSDLRRALAERLTRLGHGPASVDPEREILVGAGATHALACALRAIVGEGDDVLLVAPYWPLAHGVIVGTGARAVEVPLTDRLYADPSLDVAAVLEAARTPETRAIYIITPNNPDGKVWRRDELSEVVEFAARHDLWIVSDEAYADWVYGGEHVSTASLPGAAARTISAYSMSKSHAMAGARIGCVVAAPEVIAAARRVSVHTVFNVPVAMQRAACAALAADREFAADTRARYLAARDLAEAALGGSGLRWFSPEGGAYLFLDFSPVLAGRPLSRVMERAIDEGVLLTPGEAFGDAYASWARLCFTAVPPARLSEGIARLRRAIG